ncbi:superoxide dismutase family protein [Massilia sp. Root1485]|uniref:superoxide dismutase family protein n=1 Tax=Massilia sp. Root1485 TaxID=1736472 RepID=UPI0006F8D0C6|nr:superoxide dismutase family protein [Massilia sp. Root1485]KQZ47525.1 superoxide dismutase [Massilia sp. Root1485]
MTIKSLIALACALSAAAGAHAADQLQASMTLVGPDGTGKPIGAVTITESKSGLVFTPNLTNLPPGSHGYHVHEMASCGTTEKDGKKVPAGAAGGHFDPTGAKHHAGPSGDGHLGDLPPLVVGDNGGASTAVTAPRLTKLSEVKGKALMIHAGGDNFSDQPKPLGGGGDRIACGVIQ